MIRVAVIDPGRGNLGSVCYALERLGARPLVVREPAALAGCERWILPGVGAAGPAMAALAARGLLAALRDPPVPLLGICLGMQLLFESSAEGETPCLGLLPGRVEALPAAPGLRVPHMGWNGLEDLVPHPLLAGVAPGDQVYFVHSYAAPPGPHTIARCRHGVAFSAAVARGPLLGLQFHPERSGPVGARILANFLELRAWS
ncbi:MAG: imidazole glycerol phosphate synthase subunit HisH [Xanthomonadales bacterium]|nr:imidazole glycerol phosphate synthase subunit HisH [Xanthomonadales bacterium]